jgi:hypothetical protein
MLRPLAGGIYTMAFDIYRPELWHDFFLMVGGGAAALTGLVFVSHVAQY